MDLLKTRFNFQRTFGYDISNDSYEDVQALILLVEEEEKERKKKSESSKKKAEKEKLEAQQKKFTEELRVKTKRRK